MKKTSQKLTKIRSLELKKETIGTLANGQLNDVAGGNTGNTGTSVTTKTSVESQDPTLCYTL